MKRSSGEYATRVYSYGTVPARVAPVEGEALADQQIYLARRLWNVLVAIDRARTARYRTIMHDEVQDRIDELREQIRGLREAIKAKRKAARARAVDIDAEKEALKRISEELARLLAERKASTVDRHAARRAELDALNARTVKRIVRARQASAAMGLFWGSYNDVIQRADTARKAGEMQFRRRTTDGTLTAQIIGGAAVSRCISSDGRTAEHTFFRVEPAVPGRKWRYARMRIGSTAGAKPVWLSIPIVYHRDIPSPSIVKSVSMTRRGGRWQLNVTVNQPHAEPKTSGPAVALDVGWRQLPAGVRVAYWCDEAEKHGQVMVPQGDIDQLAKVASLRSTCDLMRDEYLPALAAWLDGQELSDEGKQGSSHLSQWRSSGRLADLVRWWADNRIDGDAEVYAAGLAWRKQYLHLANWAHNLEDQVRRRIKEQYRVFAAGLVAR